MQIIYVINMVSNEEIKIKHVSKKKGLYHDEEIKDALKTQRPSEWVDNVCIIDFGSISIEHLALTVKNLFEYEGYSLEKGNTVDGIYGRGHASLRLLLGYFAFRYKFKVEIYLEAGNTFLKIYKSMTGLMEGIIDGWQGLALYNKEFYRIIELIKYLGNKTEGYIICDKCGGYYKLQYDEFPEDFDKCRCGGNLEYVKYVDIDE